MRTLKWLHGNSITHSHSVDWLLFKVPQRARKTSSATFGIHMIYKYKNIKHCKGNIASWFHEDIVNVKFYLTRISEIFEQSTLQENRIRFTVRPLLYSVVHNLQILELIRSSSSTFMYRENTFEQQKWFKIMSLNFLCCLFQL